jgi:hypothetical protein
MEDKIEKIVVKAGDELIDVVRKISNTQANKILVSFVEDSDILISSINLKVLLDSAEEKESLLVLQIPNNLTGVRNAKLAGITVVDTPSLPTEEVWESAKSSYKDRSEQISKMKSKLPQDYKSENITSFEERINSVLDKNKEERVEGKKAQMVEDSTDFVIDEDISIAEGVEKVTKKEDLTKVDFKDVPNPINKSKSKGAFLASITGFFKKFGKKKQVTESRDIHQSPQKSSEEKKERLLRLLPKIVIPLVAVLFLAFFLYYYFAPYVRVTIFIESKPVEVEKVFTGNENINEIDFESLEIPIKKETVTKSVSDTVTATGTAFRGDKATGNVTISYINPDGCTDADDTLNLSEGHQITTDGKNYILTGNLTATCNNYSVVGVEAVEVGEEYNIAAGKYFSVNGYNSSTVYGLNSAAFTGGSKEEYTVLSQKDVNGKVEELTKIAKEEAENSLTDIGSGWEIIESTIKSEVKEGSIKTAVAIGTESNSSDVSLEVESSATYYYTEGVDAGLNSLLTEAAVNQNLFESSEGLDLTLTGDIEKELQVSEEGGDVNITLTASSSVEPSVKKDDLIGDLMGMGWEEGREYLSGLSFTADRDPIIVFTPENFPLKLRRFPKRQGRINLLVEKVEVDNS